MTGPASLDAISAERKRLRDAVMDQRKYVEHLQLLFDHSISVNVEMRCWMEFKLICAKQDLKRFQDELAEFERGLRVGRQTA